MLTTQPAWTGADRAARTADLLDRAHRSGSAERKRALLDEVVVLNRGVARSVAGRFAARGVPRDDLDQAAYEGLIKAVRRYDPAYLGDLLAFAVPTIRGEVRRYFRDQGWMVRPPRRIQELQARIRRSTDRLATAGDRAPSVAEVCADLAIAVEEYDEALAARGCFRAASLDRPLRPDSGATLGDLLVALDDGAAGAEARAMLAPAVRRLSARDRRALDLRYFGDLTQEQVGDRLGLSQVQTSRLLARILRDLRRALEPVTAVG